MTDAPLSGRRAEAERNHGRILDAAREVFLADPAAPMSAVAARAHVGISALYRRYPGKDDLLRSLTADGLTRFAQDLDAGLADKGDPWTAYRDCIVRIVAGGSQGLAQRLAGTFTPTPELHELSAHADTRWQKLHRRAQRAGALRKDVSAADVVLLLEMIMGIDLPGPERGAALRERYLAVVLQSLRATDDTETLPGRPAAGADLAIRWRRD